jgi:hypothetical protein
MHKKLALLLLLTFPIFSDATEIAVSGKVVRILNYEGHQGPLVIMENMTTTTGLCQRNDYYILPLAHKYFKQNNDLLLAAKLTDKSVTIGVDSDPANPANCVDGFNRIKHVSIDN